MRKNTPKIPVKNFADWQPEQIEKVFGIAYRDNMRILSDLCNVKPTIPQEHAYYKLLDEWKNKARRQIEGWNEDEYKFFFISPFLALIDFSTPYFNAFTQRPMSMLYDNDTQKTEGRVEWMLARGRNIPEKPHFFLHATQRALLVKEYKPEKRRDNDPLGQVLIAMVCAQRQNQDDKPVYGMYINGRNWFMVVLEGKEYAVSEPFVITTDDIFKLFAVLEYLKLEMIKLYQ